MCCTYSSTSMNTIGSQNKPTATFGIAGFASRERWLDADNDDSASRFEYKVEYFWKTRGLVGGGGGDGSCGGGVCECEGARTRMWGGWGGDFQLDRKLEWN